MGKKLNIFYNICFNTLYKMASYQETIVQYVSPQLISLFNYLLRRLGKTETVMDGDLSNIQKQYIVDCLYQSNANLCAAVKEFSTKNNVLNVYLFGHLLCTTYVLYRNVANLHVHRRSVNSKAIVIPKRHHFLLMNRVPMVHSIPYLKDTINLNKKIVKFDCTNVNDTMLINLELSILQLYINLVLYEFPNIVCDTSIEGVHNISIANVKHIMKKRNGPAQSAIQLHLM